MKPNVLFSLYRQRNVYPKIHITKFIPWLIKQPEEEYIKLMSMMRNIEMRKYIRALTPEQEEIHYRKYKTLVEK
jgi:predicted SAM-dependent methyltransferase